MCFRTTEILAAAAQADFINKNAGTADGPEGDISIVDDVGVPVSEKDDEADVEELNVEMEPEEDEVYDEELNVEADPEEDEEMTSGRGLSDDEEWRIM